MNAKLKKDLYFPDKNLSVVISGPGLHHLDETGIPDIGVDEVLINIQYVGVCSTDLDVLEGNLGYYRSGWAKYPIIPGHEFSGIIALAGTKVAGLMPGDKVVGECILGCGACAQCLAESPINCKARKEVGVLNFNGAYSRYLKMPARFVHKLPDEASLNKACLIEPLAVAVRGINKLFLGENSRQKKLIAVLGHGTIGNLCAQLITLRGHDIVIFDNNPLRIRDLKINEHVGGETNIVGLDRFDYIVEATGNPDVLKKALGESKTGVKILLLGLPYASFDFNFESIVSHDKTILGSVGSSKKEFDQAVDIYEKMDLDSLTRNVFPLSNYEKAWQHHKNGQVAKAILRINET
ncbi:MAG: alcohol dehydrogenase catalytic domain-containing protein [Syntrophaceae bacterium]